MKERKLTKDDQGVNKVSFAEGLRRIASGGISGKFTEQEKVLFERAKCAEEESKKRSFVLGRQLD